jgi:hypothetical protein
MFPKRVAVLPLVFSFALTYPARGSVDLFNNLGVQSVTNGPIVSGYPYATSFSTGASDFNLSSVAVMLGWNLGSTIPSADTVTVWLLADASNSPGSVLETIGTLSYARLAAPTLNSNYHSNTFFAASQFTLAPYTRYWIEITTNDTTQGQLYWSFSSNISGTTGTSGEFWSGNGGGFVYADGTDGGPPQMEVSGFPLYTPPPTVPPGDLHCAAGVNGPGNIYDPATSYCASGVVVPNADALCAAGVNGAGGIYDPTASSCDSGIVVPNADAFCAAGAYGPGYLYDPTMSSCDNGVGVPNGDSFCPPGSLGPGGLYNPSAGDSCNDGVVTFFSPLPPVLSSSQVSVTASGLTYSRASRTLSGSVTIKNIGSSMITGPFEILFTGLPVNVTLLNPSGDISGAPYLTIPAVAKLTPDQSATVTAQFTHTFNATIRFTAVVYFGSIN